MIEPGNFALFQAMSPAGGVLLCMARPHWVNTFFGNAQLASAADMGPAQGPNNAQKTGCIIAMALGSAH